MLSDLGLHMRAGDGNRTRTVSLGIRPIGPPDQPDLGNRRTASDRHWPHDTAANGPSMARDLTGTGAQPMRRAPRCTTSSGGREERNPAWWL